MTETRAGGPDDLAGQHVSRDDGGASLLAQLPDDSRRALLSVAVPVSVAAGEWLFRQGDPGDAMFVLTTGSLEVVVEDPAPGAVVRTLRRGDALGELSLLAGSPRSASVRARRDSTLLRVGRTHMASLLAEHPSFSLALTKALGRQLQEGPAGPATRRPPPEEVMTIVPAHSGAAVDALREELHRALSLSGSACWIDQATAGAALAGSGEEENHSAYGELVDRFEREHDHVVLVADRVEGGSAWDRFCLRQADRLIVVARSSHPPPGPEGRAALAGSDLIFVDHRDAASGSSEWLTEVKLRAWHHVASRPDLARAVRRLTGRSIGVVLSGGGARGLAHIGVLEALAESGLQVDRVGGCSMGAFLGALHAMGRSAEEIARVCRRELVERNAFNDFTMPRVSLIRAKKAETMLRRVFGDRRIEELALPFFCVSADLFTGQVVHHTSGPLWRAVGASMSLPGLCPPVVADERLLVDGGVLNNLPVDLMSAAEGPVIASDVMVRELRSARTGSEPHAGGHSWLGLRRAGSDAPRPGIVDTLARTSVLGSCRLAEQNRQLADLVIAPDVAGIAMFGFDQLEIAVEAGRTATRRSLRDQAGRQHPTSGAALIAAAAAGRQPGTTDAR